MEAIHFDEANVEFAKNQPQYQPLPAYREKDERGRIVTKWKFSPEELAVINETGVIWLDVLTFNQPLQPLLPYVDDPFK